MSLRCQSPSTLLCPRGHIHPSTTRLEYRNVTKRRWRSAPEMPQQAVPCPRCSAEEGPERWVTPVHTNSKTMTLALDVALTTSRVLSTCDALLATAGGYLGSFGTWLLSVCINHTNGNPNGQDYCSYSQNMQVQLTIKCQTYFHKQSTIKNKSV